MLNREDASVQQPLLMSVRWQEIVLVNFEVDPRILLPRVPPQLELDDYDGAAFVTLVARKCFVRASLSQLVPARFLEMHLRFYVRRRVGDETRRGIMLVRDFNSSHRGLRIMQRRLGKQIEHLPMKSNCQHFDGADPNEVPTAEYQWYLENRWNQLRVKARSAVRRQQAGTREHFIFGHKFGYICTSHATKEFAVEHAPWVVWDAASGNLDCEFEPLFDRDIARRIRNRPASVFLARGGDARIYRPMHVTEAAAAPVA